MMELQRAARGIGLSVALLLALPRPVRGQAIDARLVPTGVLRFAFTPEYQTWDRMFDASGSVIPLGKYLSSDSAGADRFPTMVASQAAIFGITGSQSYR